MIRTVTNHPTVDYILILYLRQINLNECATTLVYLLCVSCLNTLLFTNDLMILCSKKTSRTSVKIVNRLNTCCYLSGDLSPVLARPDSIPYFNILKIANALRSQYCGARWLTRITTVLSPALRGSMPLVASVVVLYT